MIYLNFINAIQTRLITPFLMQFNSKLSKNLVIVRAFFAGILFGIVARLWMRWISTSPEFSWSGTIGIVAVFIIFLTAQSIVMVFGNSTTNQRKNRLIRFGGLVFTLPLFMAAGGMMLPTVALASFALWSGVLQKRGKILFLGLSGVMPIIISKDIINDFGFGFATLGRILLFLLIYTLIILAIRPTVTPSSLFAERQKPL